MASRGVAAAAVFVLAVGLAFPRDEPPTGESKGIEVFTDSTDETVKKIRAKLFDVPIGKDAIGNEIKIRCWKSTTPNLGERYSYSCHGLTFGGYAANKMSPTNDGASLILEKFYKPIDPADAHAGDVLVWRNSEAIPIHSGIIEKLTTKSDHVLDADKTTVNSKNGVLPEKVETVADLEKFFNTRKNPTTVMIYTLK
ncbi:hypothetical protein PX52LOC_01535 [Limnoglobus roseus]|uniref:Uncharacterized protein n=2 Tax=Limnoglobus roseus TaxID=2598579 RepID=A0A5C1A8W1_9BACT|nr:hypothetical protein PX52LOC_01535 [Limnoglobus roseus]